MQNNEENFEEVDFMEIYTEYLKQAINIVMQEKILAIAKYDYAMREIESLKEEIKKLKEE